MKGKSIFNEGCVEKFGGKPNRVCSKAYVHRTKKENGRPLKVNDESDGAHPFVRTASEAWHQSFRRSLNNINGLSALLPRCQFGSASKLVGSLMVYHQNSGQVERAGERTRCGEGLYGRKGCQSRLLGGDDTNFVALRRGCPKCQVIHLFFLLSVRFNAASSHSLSAIWFP